MKPPLQGRAWVEPDVERLKLLWGQGVSATQIGVALDRSRNSVLGKLHRCGLLAKKQPQKRNRRERLSPKLNPKPRPKVAAKRSRQVPPPPPLNEAPKPPRYIPKEQLRKPLPGSNPHAVLIETTGCKFPVGEYPFHWCNEPKAEGKPYCTAHCAVAFQRVEKEQPQHIGDVAARVVADVRRKMDAMQA